jgi:hypothetical protein
MRTPRSRGPSTYEYPSSSAGGIVSALASASDQGQHLRRNFHAVIGLVDSNAWLGATADRYSFEVETFHLDLHAGLSRRFPKGGASG